ncbi:MAG: hypothetical protein PHI18_04115 [bacterium]|nr:hypothetical protein [bacterium]
MDRRLWIMTAIVALLLSAASTFMGIQSETLASRTARIQFACRQPEVSQTRMTRMFSAADSATFRTPNPRTDSLPGRVNMAGF